MPGEEPIRPPRDGSVEVRLSADRMVAYIVIRPPESGGRPVTMDQAQFALTRADVVFGIDSAALAAAIANQEGAAATICVARGTPPVPGEDARMEFNPILFQTGGQPRQNADGSVDLLDLGWVRNVAQGTVLATRQPARPGTPGRNVLGQEVPAPVPWDSPLRAGRGAAVTEDGVRLVSVTAGHAVRDHDVIRVEEVYVVPDDVGTATGHVEFVGSVVVRGNVHPGFRIRAGGDVEVWGGVDGGIIEAGGNVIIRYGLQGSGRGHVQAGGNLRCLFIQNARVCAGGNVTVPDGILHSEVRAAGRVDIMGRRGTVIGGSLRAGGEVRVRVLGAPAGTATEVAVGIAPQVREELEQVSAQIQETVRALRSIRQAVPILRQQEQEGRLTPDRAAMLGRLLQEEAVLAPRLEAGWNRTRELEGVLSAMPQAWVQADICYPGVRVIVGSHPYLVDDTLRRVRFALGDTGEVRQSHIQ